VEPLDAVPSLPPVSDRADATLADFQQGEIIKPERSEALEEETPGGRANFVSELIAPLLQRLRGTRVTAIPEHPLKSMPNGAVVLSQTCDIVQRDRLTVQIAPLVPLSGSMANEARIRRRPQYVPLPNAPENLFIDLERLTSVHKNDLVDITHEAGINSQGDARKLAQSIGRRFTRFPFPDNVHPWLRPLEEVLQTKADRPNSPEGIALQSVMEIRVEAKGKWEDPPPYVLTILFVVEPGILPYGPRDEVPEVPTGLSGWLRGGSGALKRTASQIADRLNKASSAADRYYLWLALGEAWAAQCHPRPGASQAVMREVEGSIDGEVLSADELTMDRWWGSEALDLDHLSPPRPA
jgi:hypothetical protein